MESQFTGQWNLNSAFWTPDAKDALGYETLDSRTFYMTMNEYMQHMESAYVNMIGQDYSSNMINGLKGSNENDIVTLYNF